MFNIVKDLCLAVIAGFTAKYAYENRIKIKDAACSGAEKLRKAWRRVTHRGYEDYVAELDASKK